MDFINQARKLADTLKDKVQEEEAADAYKNTFGGSAPV